MKRVLSALLVLLLIPSLSGCQEAETLLSDVEELLPKVEELIPQVEELLSGNTETTDTTETGTTGTAETTETGTTAATEAAESPAEEPEEIPDTPTDNVTAGSVLPEDGVYDSRDDVALYLITYHHLPDNYITKAEARELGWNGGGLEKYASGKCIGGDWFGNREGNLPKGHTYTECDIDTLGASSRGAKRIVFSEDFSIYYTGDHYESFTLLYEGGTAP